MIGHSVVGARRRARPRRLPAAVAAMALLAAPAVPADTVLEQRIAESNPCQGLKVQDTVFGMPLNFALDQVDDVTLRSLDLQLRGDAVVLTLSGALSCRTPTHTPIAGSASVDLTAEARADLTRCHEPDVAFRDVSFGGSFGPILRGLWGAGLERTLLEATRELIVDVCNDLGA